MRPDVRTIAMQPACLHLERGAPGGMRGQSRPEVAERAAGGVLREGAPVARAGGGAEADCGCSSGVGKKSLDSAPEWRIVTHIAAIAANRIFKENVMNEATLATLIAESPKLAEKTATAIAAAAYLSAKLVSDYQNTLTLFKVAADATKVAASEASYAAKTLALYANVQLNTAKRLHYEDARHNRAKIACRAAQESINFSRCATDMVSNANAAFSAAVAAPALAEATSGLEYEHEITRFYIQTYDDVAHLANSAFSAAYEVKYADDRHTLADYNDFDGGWDENFLSEIVEEASSSAEIAFSKFVPNKQYAPPIRTHRPDYFVEEEGYEDDSEFELEMDAHIASVIAADEAVNAAYSAEAAWDVAFKSAKDIVEKASYLRRQAGERVHRCKVTEQKHGFEVERVRRYLDLMRDFDDTNERNKLSYPETTEKSA